MRLLSLLLILAKEIEYVALHRRYEHEERRREESWHSERDWSKGEAGRASGRGRKSNCIFPVFHDVAQRMEVQPVTPDAVAPAVAVQEGSGAAQEGDGAEVEDGAVAMTEALSLRMGVIHSIRSLNGSRLRSLLTRFCLSLAQIVAFSVILAKASAAQETCEQPLRIYLALHLTRISLSLPRQSNFLSLVTESKLMLRVVVSIYAGLVPPVPSRHDTAAIIAAQEANRRIGSPRLDLRLRKISDLLALASVILFILANVWVFSSTCDRNAPLLYYGALAALIISYLYVAEVRPFLPSHYSPLILAR